MILSRFWYVILAGVAVAGLATALLATHVVNDMRHDNVVDDLRRDRFEIEAMLKLDARSRIDAIGQITAQGDVRSALRTASGRTAGQPVPAEQTTRLRARLVELNDQLDELKGDLLFAVDAQGYIVAAIAPGIIPPGAGIGEFPLVRRALEGYARDDVWVYNDGVYRMAARPVVDGGQYVGALVHGKRLDDALAERLSARLDGASVSFFHGSAMIASHMPSGAPRRDDAAASLAQVLTNERLQAGERTDAQELPTGGLAVYSLITGTARTANVGYAIARSVDLLDKPWDLVLSAPEQAWRDLLQVWWLWAALGFAIIVAMLSVWIERDRPLGKLRRAVQGLTSSPDNRLTVPDFGGPHRRIAQSINEALDRAAEAGGIASGKRKPAANLDEILGPGPAGPAPGSFYGFAGGGGGPSGGDMMMMPDVPPAAPSAPPIGGGPMGPPMGGPSAPPLGGPPPPSLGGPAAMPMGAPPAPGMKPPAPPAPPKPPLPPALKKPVEAPPPAAPPAAAAAAAAELDTTNVAKPTPGGAAANRKQLKRTLLGVPPPQEEDEDEGATMVARVPDELLAQSSQPNARAMPSDDEEAHFREVYEKFLETKKQCSEPTAGLTYEKFLVTLKKNRDQIVSRHGARKVRFTVYVKNGKAALKATPIRE